MPAATVYSVQQFDRIAKRIVAGRRMDFRTAAEAIGRAERDAFRTVGVLAVQQVLDDETGEPLEEPVILASHGELPTGLLDS